MEPNLLNVGIGPFFGTVVLSGPIHIPTAGPISSMTGKCSWFRDTIFGEGIHVAGETSAFWVRNDQIRLVVEHPEGKSPMYGWPVP